MVWEKEKTKKIFEKNLDQNLIFDFTVFYCVWLNWQNQNFWRELMTKELDRSIISKWINGVFKQRSFSIFFNFWQFFLIYNLQIFFLLERKKQKSIENWKFKFFFKWLWIWENEYKLFSIVSHLSHCLYLGQKEKKILFDHFDFECILLMSFYFNSDLKTLNLIILRNYF